MAEWPHLPGAECGAQMPSADDGDYPPVTWQEVREHLIRRHSSYPPGNGSRRPAARLASPRDLRRR
jgi:hypothetical protein